MNNTRRILARKVIVDGTDYGMAIATIGATVTVQPFDGRETHSTTFHPGILRVTTAPLSFICE